jgi:hypothetical protein
MGLGLNRRRRDPDPDPEPAPKTPRTMRISVWPTPFTPLHPILIGGFVQLDDSAGTTTVGVMEDGRIRVELPDNAVFGHGANLTTVWDNERSITTRIILAADVDASIPAMQSSTVGLHLTDRYGFTAIDTGARVPWRGATAFQFIECVARNDMRTLDTLIASMPDVNVYRTLCMLDAGLFTLHYRDGIAALPRALEFAQAHGVYLELTIFAGTKFFPELTRADMKNIVRDVSQIAHGYNAAIALELGNELEPLHHSQSAILSELDFLHELRADARAYGNIPVSLGSAHGGADESDRMRLGDYLTVHGDRANGDFGWRWVRHTKEQRDLSERVNRYCVNDEPRRDDLATDKHFAMGVLCRMMNLGDTFHYHSGLNCKPPVLHEGYAYQMRARGWNAIPDDWRGHYLNTGHAGSPVRGFTNAVRVYSSVSGANGYTLAMGASADPNGGTHTITWSDEWPQRELLMQVGHADLYFVSK